MRTIEEFREHKLESLALSFQRPTMFCPGDIGPDRYFWSVFADLCWIDGRNTEWNRVKEKHLWGCSGVLGQLRDQPVTMPGYFAESISTWAQVAWVLGYFRPERLLTRAEWTDLKGSLNSEFFDREWLESEIPARYGPPSYGADNGCTDVLAYACEDPAESWVFMDFSRTHPDSEERYPDPLLRDVRIERNRFQLMKSADWCRRNVQSWPFRVGGEDIYLNMAMVSFEGDHLDALPEILSRSGYVVEKEFFVESGQRLSEELGWCGGPRRIAMAAWRANGWTHVIDPETALMSNPSLLEFSAERNTRILGWLCDLSSRGYTLVSEGSRLRDVLYSHGGVIVNRGDPLPEESHIDWSSASEENMLELVARFGAPYEDLGDRRYLIFHVDQADQEKCV